MNELLASPSQIGVIALRTIIVYAFILVGFRLAGKREVGQLAPFDFALILLIANAVQNAMVGPDSSLVGGLSAAAVLLVINAALGHLASTNRKIEGILRGHAQLLIYRGKVHTEHLKKEGLSHAELLQALRENGCATIEECRLAVLEVDGTISVVAEKS
ncbi:MAG: DUF421 domain-containing protein [Vicinamibacteria bacterium]